MSTTPGLRKERERGQVLALFTFGLVAMIAMVAFVVDGGNAFAQERRTQNGTDAAALAGATVLAERLGGAPKTNADVLAAVTATATAMEMAVESAEYTDLAGTAIGTVPDTAAAPPSAAAGVAVTGRRPFDTYFARAIGINEFTAVTEAIAIAGYGQPWISTLLPVTPPVNILACDGQNRPAFQLPLTRWETNRIYKVPLCRSAPGNVGWIDWTPPSGGTSELAACIADSSTPGCDYPIELPSWNYVAQTGNTNSGQVETALRIWDGQQVFLPLFDDTCGEDPGAPDADCPSGPNSGQGQGLWYHFPAVGVFELCTSGVTDSHGNTCTPHGAYIQGNNRAECEDGNGATSCLVGQFRNLVTEGRVTGPVAGDPSPSSFVVVQLIG